MYICPVCGYKKLREDPLTSSYEICPCCGTEFGYCDFSRSHTELRDEWIGEGCNWWSRRRQAPEGWNPVKQMKAAGLIDES